MNLAMVRQMVHREDRGALYSRVDVEIDVGVHPIAEFRIVTAGSIDLHWYNLPVRPLQLMMPTSTAALFSRANKLLSFRKPSG